MTALTVQDGKLVLRDGALGVGEGCCCGGCECVEVCADPAIYINGEYKGTLIQPQITGQECWIGNTMPACVDAEFACLTGYAAVSFALLSLTGCDLTIEWLLEPCSNLNQFNNPPDCSGDPYPYDPDQYWLTQWKVCGYNPATSRIKLQLSSKALVGWNKPPACNNIAEDPDADFGSLSIELDCNPLP